MNTEWMNALLGGMLIGLSASLMLYWNGRVAGISGILYGIVNPAKNETNWRWYFISGIFSGGLVLQLINPDVFVGQLTSSNWTVVIAGMLVGFGTVLGSGCTSGHGICGMSRLSVRSIVATFVFMGAGIASVYFFKKLGVY